MQTLFPTEKAQYYRLNGNYKQIIYRFLDFLPKKLNNCLIKIIGARSTLSAEKVTVLVRKRKFEFIVK